MRKAKKTLPRARPGPATPYELPRTPLLPRISVNKGFEGRAVPLDDQLVVHAPQKGLGVADGEVAAEGVSVRSVIVRPVPSSVLVAEQLKMLIEPGPHGR